MEEYNLKKIISFFLCIIFCIALTSCSSEPLQGDELINKAKEDYTSLNSGKLTVTNADSGEVEQTFIFMIDENDVMKYYFCGKNGDYEDQEYYDGEIMVTLESGEKTVLKKGDDNFPEYTREDRHPNASKEMLLYQPNAIKTVEITESGEETTITHTYFANAFNSTNNNSKVTNLVVVFRFDKDSNLVDLTEKSEVKAEGKVTKDTYIIAITNQNAITSIENLIE